MKSLKFMLAAMLLCSTSLLGCTDFADGVEFDAGAVGERPDSAAEDGGMASDAASDATSDATSDAATDAGADAASDDAS